jgi:phosphoenolpyruvate---glycerone phosphotransferase subunit DhaL
VGGTSGPIWGTAFMRAGAAAGTKPDLEGADVVAMLRAAVGGIMARGGASLGDKTLLDALAPATDTLEAGLAGPGADNGVAALAAASETAQRAAEATASLIAKRGRASYTGERSIGSPDAGAVAIGVLFAAVSAAWAGYCAERSNVS